MFGFITADFSRLTDECKKEYKKYYCGLCHALSERYGKKARFILNFDLTFLLIMLSIKKGDDKLADKKCPYCLYKKRECKIGEICDYVADVSILLTMLNFDDDIKDDKSIKAGFGKKILLNEYHRAKSLRQGLYQKLTDKLSDLAIQEQNGQTDFQIPADIFGSLLSDVFAYDDELCEFGFYLGRFIYLYDAVIDFKKDLKKGKYNPLTACRVKDFENILTCAMDECIISYQKLGIQSELVDNVLHYGVWLKYGLKYKRKTL